MFNATIKPAQIEIVAKPGISFTQAYNVTNNSDSPLVVSTSVLPWHPVDNDGAITYQNISPNPNFQFSLSNADLRLGQTFVLRPREGRQLVLKIKTADNTELGDAYFTFFINQDQGGQLNSDNSGGQATARLGSHLLISTANTENPTSTLKVTEIKTSPRIVDVFFPKINILGTINNESDYFTKTTGKLTISSRGKIVTESELFPHNVLAHSSRNISCLTDNNPVPCTLNPPYWPGIYTATINNASTTFYVFPFSIILFVLLIGIFTYTLLSHFFNPGRH